MMDRDQDQQVDHDLLMACRAGNSAAFATLYERYQHVAKAVAALMRVPRCERDDVASEAFANILSAIGRGNGPVDNFRPYLVTAVRNIVLTQSRRSMRADDSCRRLTVEVERSQIPQEGLDHDMLAHAMSGLPPRWQYILRAVEVEGRRPAQLAGELDMTPNAVAALVARARRGLRAAYLEGLRVERLAVDEPALV